jgi:hypothetical protein
VLATECGLVPHAERREIDAVERILDLASDARGSRESARSAHPPPQLRAIEEHRARERGNTASRNSDGSGFSPIQPQNDRSNGSSGFRSAGTCRRPPGLAHRPVRRHELPCPAWTQSRHGTGLFRHFGLPRLLPVEKGG